MIAQLNLRNQWIQTYTIHKICCVNNQAFKGSFDFVFTTCYANGLVYNIQILTKQLMRNFLKVLVSTITEGLPEHLKYHLLEYTAGHKKHWYRKHIIYSRMVYPNPLTELMSFLSWPLSIFF